MRSEIARRVLVYAATLLFLGALVHRFHWLGGPYFALPETIQDHVWPARFLSADAIVLSRRAEPLLPRGATVTLLAPREAPNYDQTHWLTGLGLLTHQRVVPQKLDPPPQYVIAIGDPFDDARYALIKTFPEGYLYELKR
ncbi:MAG TPA: hypothetical protein VJZ00_07750 [Thermoanaerobaculia bacterium]|nr:hypothetical protein [Thermoanaerobaculia bacterium]